jgi:glycosyltransferase involved in cell wall biosynthesis
MHILLIHQAFAGMDEAGGTRHIEMARHLASAGHRVTIITSPVSYLSGKVYRSSRWVDRQLDSEGVVILRCYTYAPLHRSFLHRVLAYVSFMLSSFIVGAGVKQVDIVWGTSPPIFQLITAWLLARVKRASFLLEVRDLWPAFAVAIGVLRNRIIILASEWLERFLYRRADQIIVNSPGYIEHVRIRTGRQITLIPNGVDVAQFNPELPSTDWRREHHLEDKYIIMYAGAHGLSNDLGVVLEAASKLMEHSDIQFVLVGDGKEKPALINQAEHLHLQNILFLPPVTKEKMPELLAAADACIAILKPIELYKTTYPNKVFDYMAAGRPILLVIDGVIREVLEQASAGLFVQPGNAQSLSDAIQWMADHSEIARDMGKSGRNFVVQHYNRIQLSNQLTCLIESMGRLHARKNLDC